MATVDPYRRYEPIRLGIHVCADESGESVTVRNYDLSSPELARLRSRPRASRASTRPEIRCMDEPPTRVSKRGSKMPESQS
jgi:hypothetical protein